jgi:transcription elongation factor Elf1
MKYKKKNVKCDEDLKCPFCGSYDDWEYRENSVTLEKIDRISIEAFCANCGRNFTISFKATTIIYLK